MRKVWVWGGAALTVAIAACATSTAPGGGSGQNDSDAGDIPLYDAGGTTTKDGSSTTCTLGTADHCGGCGTACPGVDNDGTTRVCSDSTTTATCDIICKGEYYDLNGTIDDGCEAQDPVVHDNADASVPQAATTGGTNVGDPYWYLYGDARQHDVAPTARTLGREDWYVVSHPNGALKVCLSISNFPSDDKFEACVSNVNNKNIPTTGSPCVTVMMNTPGSSTCVTPEDGGNMTGSYYVRVRKLDGSNTPNGYALFLQD